MIQILVFKIKNNVNLHQLNNRVVTIMELLFCFENQSCRFKDMVRTEVLLLFGSGILIG